MFLVIGSTLTTYATHLMGGEITLQDLGNQEYQVTLIVYRDTVGIPMSTTAAINFNGPNNASFSISIPYDSVISGSLLPMYPYGVEIYLFVDTVTLSAYGQWDVSWENCCRNAAIINLSNPLNESMTLVSSIVTDSASSNSSPFFLVPAAIFLPDSTSWQYNPLPFDPDGDSLHWSIDQPLSDTGVYCAGYITPSSDPSNVFSIDPITGTISWTANVVGHYVASILVDQYRNGIWVGEIRRDMQFIVVPSGQGSPIWNNLASIPTDANNNFAINLVAGEPFYLEMIATHTDPTREVYMEAYSEIFHLPQTNASFIETINATNTVGEFNWEPLSIDRRDRAYQVVFRVSDGLFTDDKTILLNVNSTVGIKASDNNNNIKVFPNPTTDFIYIEIENLEKQSAILDVYSITGKKIISQRTMKVNSGNNIFALETDSWTPGTYIINVHGDNNLSLKQMVIIK